MRKNFQKIGGAVGVLLVGVSAMHAQIPDRPTVIAAAERAFEKAAKINAMPAPGCAVGVSLNGESVFEKAFGMAEMEHGIQNTPQTIFESGSVAKQFTAAAIVLLAQDGKLRIDDDVRKYIPELPVYDKPITIRHILNHTAGLRDWGSVMQLTGVGRGDRVIDNNIALDVIIRQKHLDFTPGAEYSYSNSGYQLAAVIIERVAKRKFGDFVGERLFKPLGMTKSSWRDDYRKLVPGRAQAYSRSGPNAPWMLNMPIMNVVGNGGMLTTVGDWLKWNAMLDARTWNAKLVDELETQGILNDKRKIAYALGLTVAKYQGMRDVSHGGSTAGYQTFLARYPDQKVSVAVLCNGTSPGAGSLAASITDEIFGPYPAAAGSGPTAVTISDEQLKRFAGVWRNDKTRSPGRFSFENGALRFNGRPLRAVSEDTFMLGGTSIKFTFDKDGKPIAGESIDQEGEVTVFTAQTEWSPSAAELAAIAGEWRSEEAQSTVTVAVEGDKAFIVIRPVAKIPLAPVYKDHFSAQSYVVWITRDESGKIVSMHIGGSRMRDMRFERIRK